MNDLEKFDNEILLKLREILNAWNRVLQKTEILIDHVYDTRKQAMKFTSTPISATTTITRAEAETPATAFSPIRGSTTTPIEAETPGKTLSTNREETTTPIEAETPATTLSTNRDATKTTTPIEVPTPVLTPSTGKSQKTALKEIFTSSDDEKDNYNSEDGKKRIIVFEGGKIKSEEKIISENLNNLKLSPAKFVNNRKDNKRLSVDNEQAIQKLQKLNQFILDISQFRDEIAEIMIMKRKRSNSYKNAIEKLTQLINQIDSIDF